MHHGLTGVFLFCCRLPFLLCCCLLMCFCVELYFLFVLFYSASSVSDRYQLVSSLVTHATERTEQDLAALKQASNCWIPGFQVFVAEADLSAGLLYGYWLTVIWSTGWLVGDDMIRWSHSNLIKLQFLFFCATFYLMSIVGSIMWHSHWMMKSSKWWFTERCSLLNNLCNICSPSICVSMPPVSAPCRS